MNTEIKAILDASQAPQAIKDQALTLSVQIAAPIAMSAQAVAAGGAFLQILMQLIQVLLPLLLKYLSPPTT